MEQELNDQKQAAMRQEEIIRAEEQSVISRHIGRLEEQVRLLHDRLTPVLGPNTSVEAKEKPKVEASPLCEKIIIIEEIIEAIHNRLEV